MIANTVADTYIEYNLDYKLEGARSAISWLAEQGADLKRQLEESEVKLYEFRKSQNMLDVKLDDKQSMIGQNLSEVNAKLTRSTYPSPGARREAQKMIESARNDINEIQTLPGPWRTRQSATFGRRSCNWIRSTATFLLDTAQNAPR